MGHFATMLGHLGAQKSVVSALKAAKSLRATSGPKGVSPFEARAGLKIELSPRRRAIFVFFCAFLGKRPMGEFDGSTLGPKLSLGGG